MQENAKTTISKCTSRENPDACLALHPLKYANPYLISQKMFILQYVGLAEEFVTFRFPVALL